MSTYFISIYQITQKALKWNKVKLKANNNETNNKKQGRKIGNECKNNVELSKSFV